MSNATGSYPYCSVPACKKDPKHTCFRLPKDPSIAKMWLESTGIDEETLRKVYICEAHFDSAMIRGTGSRKLLAKRTIPTLNIPFAKSNSNINPIVTPRSNYNDLVADVIMNSLKPSASKTNKIMCIEPLSTTADHEEASSTSDKRKYDKKSEGEDKIKKKRKIIPQKIEASLKEPNYAAKTIVELQNEIEDISKLSDVLEELALNIYLTYPQAYEMLHCSLRLPPVSALKVMFKSCAISTDDNSIFAKALQMKVNMMSERQKDCVICLGKTHVKPNLYYDIKSDKLLGIVDINNIQKPEPASLALVLTVQGLFADWTQPIAVAYAGTPKITDSSSIRQWIEKNISNLLKIGFKVRAFVSETKYFEIRYLEYFEISNHKIYYIYDVLSLFKLFYYTFLTHDYSFDGGIAKMQHLLNFYKLDIKKELSLSPKLTEKHMKPTKLQNINVKQIQEVISLETAAAMSTYIDFGALDQSAKSTVQLIKKISTLFEVLNAKSFSDSIRVASGQIVFAQQFLRVMIPFFNHFKYIDCNTKEEVPKEQGSFVENINRTIKSILMLYADLKLSNDCESLPTRRLSLNNLRSFFDQVKKLGKNCELPSCKLINLAFTQSLLVNVLKPVNNIKYANLETALGQIKNLISGFKSSRPKIGYLNCNIDIKISSSEYNTLDLQKKDAVVLLAGFLLKKCSDRHADCAAMKNYICIVLHDTSSICKMILNEIQTGICVVPQESFIEFVEMMEIKFRSFMTKDILETQNGKLINGLLTAMQIVSFPMPCSCFPILYAKKLYLRLRLHTTLKYNNKSYTTLEKYKAIIVNNLGTNF